MSIEALVSELIENNITVCGLRRVAAQIDLR
jgi:hypothetical protein